MNQSTPMRRRVFLVGLTMPILVPIMRARAQGFVPPTPPGRAPFGLNWGMSFESVRKLFPNSAGRSASPDSGRFAS